MYVYLIYQTLAWFVIAFLVKFYEVSDLQHQLKLSQNYLSNSVFSFYYSFFHLFKNKYFQRKSNSYFYDNKFYNYSFFKYFFFFLFKKYRLMTHNNYRNAIIIGYTKEAIRLKEVFDNRKDYGYRFQGFF
jgi:putative colanic acid biosynthesis UDP-glucose lipid carrier transferase